MSALVPQSFAVLLARALAEFERQRTIFDLPRRSFWKGAEGVDLSVDLHGQRVDNPIGPAAGPHTQLAQNLVMGWLAGARVLELKTVQVRDRLKIPRPCIDASTVGFNVEWSQELRTENSLEQYVTAWYLIHVLGERGVVGDGWRGTVFDASIGYDLAGIRSAKITRFLDALADVSSHLARMRDSLPRGLRQVADVDVPSRLASCVTLSTFHGCPPEEIESIAEYLFERHGLNVVIKLNPTLLGFEQVEQLLRGKLGYDEIELDRDAFDQDLQWDGAREMILRLEGAAKRYGRELGVKLTNTLVVKNHKRVFADPLMYLSGQPLHVMAIRLADKIAQATHGRLQLSFSGGVDADNVADTVACGFRPVTSCTDLLRPTGYRRLPRYLKAVVADLAAHGARTLDDYIMARAGENHSIEALDTTSAAHANLADYAARVADDPRYHAAANRTAPQRSDVPLALFDCDSCNACLVACPNDAIFSVATEPQVVETCDLVAARGAIESAPSRMTITRDQQWAVFVDSCNDCGNCEAFCPQQGGPHRVKPRFFGSAESFEKAFPADGLFVQEGGARTLGRFDGILYELHRDGDSARFSDGVIEVEIDAAHRVHSAAARAGEEGHRLSLGRYHAMRLLRDAVLDRVNPVSAPFLESLTDSSTVPILEEESP